MTILDFQLAGFRLRTKSAILKLQSGTGGRVMLMGGEAFSTKRHVWWNFVSTSRERINQAKADWQAGRFPKVPGDEEEFIPLPEG